ncbi:DUF6236 family protein [Bordetella petrii]|uniref:DUF6236 family protein n=1 Tax=Bordetella petrii TaxID=94624 RepID=A0ABT7W8F2_9BORD|nr:DUF6236 family protein [Bordetella petrii]MDM9561397.1 DUF6236 family protein [Bordetella petrii]
MEARIKRSIVIGPRFTYKDGVTTAETAIRKSDLWFYLTYWDRILLPQIMGGPNILIPVEVEPLRGQDTFYQQEIGFAEPADPQKPSDQQSRIYIPDNPLEAIQVHAHREWEKKEPGFWSVSRAGGNFERQEIKPTMVSTWEFELYNALPAPAANTPLEEILDYKHRRAAELEALRFALDDMQLRLAGAEDHPRAKSHVLTQLQNALSDVRATTAESWPNRIFAAAWGSVDWGTATAFSIGLLSGRPDVGAAISLGQGAINFVRRLKKPHGGAPLPFRYVHDLPKTADQDSPGYFLGTLIIKDPSATGQRGKIESTWQFPYNPSP